VKKIERAAACFCAKSFFEKRRGDFCTLADRLSNCVPERLLIRRDPQTVMEIFNAGGSLVERRHRHSLAGLHTSTICFLC